MRVIRTCNFDKSGESPGRDEEFVLVNCTKEEAEKHAADLNKASGPNSDWYYRAVPSDYKLKEFEP